MSQISQKIQPFQPFHYLFLKRNHNIKLQNKTRTQQYVKACIDNNNLTFPSISTNYYNHTPPWTLNLPTYDTSLSILSKQNTNPEIYKKTFAEICNKYKNPSMIFTDGSKTNNHVGAGIIFREEELRYHLPPLTSIYTAEVYSLYKASQKILNENSQNFNYIIATDSLSAILNLQKPYSDEPLIQQIQENLHQSINNNNKIIIIWIPSHTGIIGNSKADAAARRADTEPITNIPIPPKDFKSTIKHKIHKSWNDEWRNGNHYNKLHNIKKDVSKWTTNGTRKHQVTISRLRIGHTLYTHKHIFEKTEPPICHTCNTQITVEHIITQCTQYTHHRQKHNIPNTLEEALANNNETLNNIISFLTDINLYRLI